MSATHGSGGTDVDAAIDALYRAPLERFTSERNALAVELRKAGQRAEADAVKGLAKPSVTAWAVNQVWWGDEPTFRAMLDAGDAQRSAHMALVRGQAADVRAAGEVRQNAVNAVVEAAVNALGGPSKVAPDMRHRIAGTVEALASGGMPPDAPPGRLTKDLQASGLEALSALAGLAPGSTAKTPAAPRPVLVSRTADKPSSSKPAAEVKAEAAARERTQKIADAKARLAEREVALRAAASEAAGTASAEKKARAALETATARVADLEEKLEAAHEHERMARRALAQATKAASEAEMIHARTTRDVKHAREQLDTLK
jgi:hypothetical protein